MDADVLRDKLEPAMRETVLERKWAEPMLARFLGDQIEKLAKELGCGIASFYF